jgi:hypothetical protein
MHFGEAFTLIGSLSPEKRKEILRDPSADLILRSASALLLASDRNLALECKVQWLLESWDSAPLDLRKRILEALGRCAAPESNAFLKEKLLDPDYRLDAINALATTGDGHIIPICVEVIRVGNEKECHAALKALSTLATPESNAVVEAAVQSAPFDSCRQWAAFMLALKGVATGESLLEARLATLQPLRVESEESGSQEVLGVEPDYLLIAMALAGLKNRTGLFALEEVLAALEKDPKIERQCVMNMTLGMIGLSTATSFEDWKIAMRRWICGGGIRGWE